MIYAIKLLLQDDGGGFMKAVGVLCNLVGWRYPAQQARERAKSVPLDKLPRGSYPFTGPADEAAWLAKHQDGSQRAPWRKKR